MICPQRPVAYGLSAGMGVVRVDGQRFDELTRLIGAGATRRRVLKGLTGALLGVGGLAGARSAMAGAVCQTEGAACGELECCGELVCFADNTCQTCSEADAACASSSECCSGNCSPSTETCQPAEEPICAFIFEDCTELPCCFDALCASDGFGNSVCFRPNECPVEGDGCGKGFCCPGLECVENICTVVCNDEPGAECGSDAACCAEAGLSCVEGVCTLDVCRVAEEACGVGAPCCGDLECDDSVCMPPVVEPECEVDADCVVVAAGDVDAAICCAGVCRQIECCIDDILTGGDPNARCDDGESCFEGLCVSICQGDASCEDDACCCEDGSCSGACCPDPVVELPKTGVADGDGGMSGLMTAGLAAGAAALLAGTKLRASDEA